jgi:hypothetical protein
MSLSPTGLYKVLAADGRPHHGGDGPAYVVGKRRSVRGRLIACQRGLHVCTERQLLRWLGPRIYPIVEVSDERLVEPDKTVVRWLVLGPALETWNERTARLFACDCAERVLPLFERDHPNDERPRTAIATARRLANGQATADERAAAEAAAWDAAWDAAEAAARAAAGAAARAAARAAAGNAAGNAARAGELHWQAEQLFRYLSGELPA